MMDSTSGRGAAADPALSDLTPAELERQYNPLATVPDSDAYAAARAPRNLAATTKLTAARDLVYGDHPRRRLDIWPARDHAAPAADGARPPPTHVFLHGGYWRARDKQDFAFVAGALVPRGATTVIVNYELCPASTLDAVAQSAIAAMGWVFRHIGDHGGDPAHITLSGHSAGAHLAGEILAHDWAAEGIDAAALKGASLISGVYDPGVATHTTINADLRLTDAIVARRNLLARPPRIACPITLYAGAAEPWLWLEQTYRYASHLRRAGLEPALHVLPGCNHFNILDACYPQEGAILDAILHRAPTPARG